MRTWLFLCVILIAAAAPPHWAHAETEARRAERLETQAPDDPLRHGRALLIGNSHYADPQWPELKDIPLQLRQLKKELDKHFNDVEIVENLDFSRLVDKINSFIRNDGNDRNARLLIYYSGHGYTELDTRRNQYAGYITAVDTPFYGQNYDAARPKAIPMEMIRAPLEGAPAKSILFIFDSCFAGTIFTNRAGDAPRPLTQDALEELMKKPARDFITAGRSDQTVPAHSPIPDLLIAALNGGADRFRQGVVSSLDIHAFLLAGVLGMHINLTPGVGKLQNSAFQEGLFWFRVTNSPFPPQPPSRGPVDTDTKGVQPVSSDYVLPMPPEPFDTVTQVLEPVSTGENRRFKITARITAPDAPSPVPSGVVIFNINGNDNVEAIPVQGGEAVLTRILDLHSKVVIRATYKPDKPGFHGSDSSMTFPIP
jgi:hypothetical protein